MAAADTIVTPITLVRENRHHHGTAACSAGNRERGFRPAFLDGDTGLAYLSRYADGRPAPVHLLDGLPAMLVIARDAIGRVISVRPGVVSGFVREGRFFTREEALRVADEEAAAMASSPLALAA